MFLRFLRLPSLPHLSRFVAASLVLVAGLAAAQGQEPQGHLPRTRITAGLYQIDAQIARSEAEREFGLMFRKEMPQAEGMIFVFEQPATQCFWMKNTILPLTAAFIADDGRIVNLADMQPQTENSHCSTEPVRYVLEMNQGWFAKKGIKAGSKLGGEVFARH